MSYVLGIHSLFLGGEGEIDLEEDCISIYLCFLFDNRSKHGKHCKMQSARAQIETGQY